MENYKQKVLNIIREKNPETMELSFGCEVKVSGVLGSDRVKFIRFKSDRMVASFVEDDEVHIFPSEPERIGSNHTIIGHPLYPAHLLVALDNKGTDTFQYSFSTCGEIEKWHYNNKDFGAGFQVEKVCQLNLTQPLEPQLDDEELCEKIYTLLSE